ncbi:hypothetical protein [Salinigranum marinum]|uniref:hypothetical protein n=1 Tax=Salinigranum marinum TaxID=1515595 RepID=UPI002989B008|nr:hypothetical protein [Salinigranum marinum]
MHRRTLLSGLGVAFVAAIAGCLGGGPPTAGDGTGGSGGSDGGGSDTDGSGGGTDSQPDGPGDGDGGPSGGGTHPRFTETSLVSTGRCDSPGTATVRFDDAGVTVTGCAHGRNGCAVAVLDDVSYTPEGDLLTVVVASVVERDPDQACTEALLPLGYEVRVAMDGMVPGVVRVVHDDVDGRREVARRRHD